MSQRYFRQSSSNIVFFVVGFLISLHAIEIAGNYILINVDLDEPEPGPNPNVNLNYFQAAPIMPVESQLEGNGHLVRYQPRHVHIAFGNTPTEMLITWSTIDSTKGSIVEYGLQKFTDNKAEGTSTFFQAPGKRNLTQYIHRVTLNNLIPSQIYRYHCGSDLGWSELFTFKAMPNGSDWSPRFAIFGDMGNENAQSLPRLQSEVQLDSYSALIHVGDFAYDLRDDDGEVGDSFMDQIQSVASTVPYMTCPGNHEKWDNFLHYKTRFTMPGNTESMFYSWNIGPVHFIAISTEFYYYLEYGVKPLITQFEWLQKDLEEATKPENRAERPWIVVYGHRPMYCSNTGKDDCTNMETLTRVGLPYVHWFGMENLFMDTGVDLLIWAHEHSYERLFPIYDHEVYNGSVEEPYRNPKALVHIITGSAGCWEKQTPFKKDPPEWSAFSSVDYGYTRVEVVNKTHLHIEQVSDDQGGKVIDSFTIIRDKHEPYPIPTTFKK